MLSILSSLAAFAVLASPTNAVTVCDGSTCATFTAGSNSDTIIVSMQSPYSGWMGIGFGSSMGSTSTYVLMYGGGISNRCGGGFAQPSVCGGGAASMGGNSFSIGKSYFNSNGATALIYATSTQAPSGDDVPQHNGVKGTWYVDISGLGSPPPKPSPSSPPAPAPSPSQVTQPSPNPPQASPSAKETSASLAPSSSIVSGASNATLSTSVATRTATVMATGTSAASLPGFISGAQVCDTTKSFCASFTVADGDANSVIVTLHSTSNGWVGIGFGTMMATSTGYFVAWKNATGATVVSQRAASSGEVAPAISATQDATPATVPSNIASDPSFKLAVSFKMPKSYFNVNGATNLIYAACSRTPMSPAALPEHDDARGGFAFDINSGTVSLAGIPSATIAHGVVMFIAWGFLPYVIIFVARYLKFRIGHAWFIIHATIGGVLMLVLTIAGVCIQAVNGGAGIVLSRNTHVIMGAIMVYGVLPLQIILGVTADRMFDVERTAIPWWDKAHWWLGRAAVLLGAVTGHYGLIQAEVASGWIIGYWLWLVMMVAVLVGGNFVFGGPTHHINEKEKEI
ncbi:hypothetical protein BC830DRAFT_1114498 [Chytriomyces sp. MP71]|nr:hypothetical protein BC830DRAFT_1114498 [Chytriomyces sp. MP71]